ncbi:MAG: hypothetical protein ACYC27_10640 [Armatimonadota bacterium]
MAQLVNNNTPSPEINYFRHDGFKFRYHSSLVLWIPADNKLDRIPVLIPTGKVLGQIRSKSYKPSDLRVIDPNGNPEPFGIYRNGKLLDQREKIKSSDTLTTTIRITNPERIECPVVLVLFGADDLPDNVDYGHPLPDKDSQPVVDDKSLDTEVGILDYTGPVDMRQPAPVIQMDAIYSARWGLWYEFAHRPTNSNPETPVFAIPINPLKISAIPGSNSTCFNMDDVPRFPLYYLRYYKATGDNRALFRARQGLDTILKYTRPDSTMPYLISPWNGKHHEGADLFDIYHSIRTMSEAIPVFKNDPEYQAKLKDAYDGFRSFVFTHMDQGLFQGRASANGAVLEAVCNRWLDTHSTRELVDIRALADALCTEHARTQRSDFGEYIPWVPLGLSIAYKATGDEKYRREAEEWVDSTIIPSLEKDRRYYYSVPDFKASGADKPWGQNPLQIWYHTDALLTMHTVSGDDRYYKLASWVFGDYYDSRLYESRPAAFIIDTNNPYTERWGSASAEDALRMIAKYLWQLKYPSLYEDARSHGTSTNIPSL